MTREQLLLIKLAEECDEVGQRCTKALWFGRSEVQTQQQFTNAERIMHELADLAGVVEMLVADGTLTQPLDFRNRVDLKKVKVEKFLLYAETCGTLDEQYPDLPGDDN